jgi:chromosome segregation ATPase
MTNSLNVYALQKGLLAQNLNTANTAVDNNQALVNSLLQQLAAAQLQLQQSQNNVTNIKTQITTLANNVTDTNNNITSATQNLKTCQASYNSMLQVFNTLNDNFKNIQNNYTSGSTQGQQLRNQISNLDSQLSVSNATLRAYQV